MSIINSFDNKTEAIINPQLTTPAIAGFPKIAVVAFGERFINALHEHHIPNQIDKMTACISIPVYGIKYKNIAIAVYCSPPGGPTAAALLEEMISKGCKKFVFFGSCGVLDRTIAAKSLIVLTSAYRDEGTSYHYAPPGEYMEVPTASRLAAILTDMKLPHICGKTWTTDAIYRETRGNMEKRVKEGCIAVEMECASIMSVAQFRSVEIYQFIYAADSLDEVEWESYNSAFCTHFGKE